MNEPELQKLRDILYERLVCDEDPGPLRARLVGQFAPEQADRLMAEAHERVAQRRRQPDFERLVQDTRKRRYGRGGFWRGRISSRPQAERIAKITAGWFGAIGVLVALSSFSSGRTDTSMLLSSLLVIVPAGFLWKAKSVVAAGVLVGIVGLSCLSSLVMAIVGLSKGESFGGAVLGLTLVWAAGLLATLRAFGAARFLRRSAAVSTDVSVFD
jgi:hypothetical protein